MKQVLRKHYLACGRVYAFFATSMTLNGDEGKLGIGNDHPDMCVALMECPASCPPPDTSSQHPCHLQCEMRRLFHEGWQQGADLARQAFATGDLEIIKAIGRDAGFTSRRFPRKYARYYAEREGADLQLHGEALQQFILAWRETGGDRRRRKGV